MYVDRGKLDVTSKVTLSVQMLLNCGVGTCDTGGSSLAVYDFFVKKYAVPWGCAVYLGTTPDEPTCSPIQQCSTCSD
jgi:hypothetical protein